MFVWVFTLYQSICSSEITVNRMAMVLGPMKLTGKFGGRQIDKYLLQLMMNVHVVSAMGLNRVL